MDTFIGTKIIQAEPMALGNFRFSQGKPIGEEEHPTQQGYRVVYPDGYVSWSPTAQFEEAYLKVPNTEGKAPWLVRLLGEEAQLTDRMNKLTAFLAAEDVVRIQDDEHRDLMTQLQFMAQYRLVLRSRILRHTKG